MDEHDEMPHDEPKPNEAPEASELQNDVPERGHEATAVGTEHVDEPVSAQPVDASIPTPEHVPLPDDIQVKRRQPDMIPHPGTREVSFTNPVIGPVEGNIPMPSEDLMVGLPFKQMGVADSFHVSGLSLEAFERMAAEWVEKHAPNIMFKIHSMQGGHRIWRVR